MLQKLGKIYLYDVSCSSVVASFEYGAQAVSCGTVVFGLCVAVPVQCD